MGRDQPVPTRFLLSMQGRKLTKRGQENAPPARCKVMDEMLRRPKSRRAAESVLAEDRIFEPVTVGLGAHL